MVFLHNHLPSYPQAVEIFRKFCFGEGKVGFEVLSDQLINFPDRDCVNYEVIRLTLPLLPIL